MKSPQKPKNIAFVPFVPLLNVFLKELKSQYYYGTCTPLLTIVPFIIVNTEDSPHAHQWMEKENYIHNRILCNQEEG